MILSKLHRNISRQKKITTVTTGAYIREDKLDFLNSIPNFGIDLSLITMQGKREAIIPRSERERTMTLLKYAPLNKCTLMFTGSIYDIQKDLELLYGLGVDKKGQTNSCSKDGTH